MHILLIMHYIKKLQFIYNKIFISIMQQLPFFSAITHTFFKRINNLFTRYNT